MENTPNLSCICLANNRCNRKGITPSLLNVNFAELEDKPILSPSLQFIKHPSLQPHKRFTTNLTNTILNKFNVYLTLI